MLGKILPPDIYKAVSSRLNPEKVYEIRLRSFCPAMVNYGGTYYYITQGGISDRAEDAFIPSAESVNAVTIRAAEYSLYSVNNQLTKGFITVEGGIRIGVCGETVWENESVKTIKGFTSVNIRVPHEVKGCSLTAYSFIADTRLNSALIAAPPGAGKTTFLRDIARNLCDEKPIKNVLVVDERSEIAAVYNGKAQLDVGRHCDIISNCSKEYAFSYAIRSMRPDIIITDELMGEKDIGAAAEAALSGVKVIASVHAADSTELMEKKFFKEILSKKIFSRYIFVSARNGPGTYESIYDGDLKCIYYPL